MKRVEKYNIASENKAMIPSKEIVELLQNSYGADVVAAVGRLKQIFAENSDIMFCGRVIHGCQEEDFTNLSCNRDAHGVLWKRTAWVFGPDALERFVGKSAKEFCLLLGFDERWLKEKCDKGVIFKLAVFPVSGDATKVCFEESQTKKSFRLRSSLTDYYSVEKCGAALRDRGFGGDSIATGKTACFSSHSGLLCARRATWDGVADMIRIAFPEVATKVFHHLPAIRSMPYEEIEKMAGYSLFEVNLQGREAEMHTRYVSLARLTEMENPSLPQIRQFLFDEIGCNVLFVGDGFTRNENEDQDVEASLPRLKEYLVMNYNLAEIAGCTVTDLQVVSKERENC